MSSYPEAPKVAEQQIRVITVAEYKPAALALAEAFAKDDVARFIIDTPDRAHWTEQQKWDLHLSAMEYITYAHCMNGMVTTVGPGYGCVALWMPPGANTSVLQMTWMSGIWRLYYKLSRIGRHRLFSEFFPILHDTKEAVLGHDCSEYTSWYLVYIGTRPVARGNGYAKMLIRDVARRADEEGTACYLESSNVVNLRLYGGLGFEVRKQIWLSRGFGEPAVPLDIMVRTPIGSNRLGTDGKQSSVNTKGDWRSSTRPSKVGASSDADSENSVLSADQTVKLRVTRPALGLETKPLIMAGTDVKFAGVQTLAVATSHQV